MPSVNLNAFTLIQKLCASQEKYGVRVRKTRSGTTLIDAGIEAKGGFEAGILVTEVCMGGLGKARTFSRQYDGTKLPSIFVDTDQPAVATLGSQLAGWHVKVGGFSAIGSGPARALALKPHRIFDRIRYRDEANVAVLVLETDKEPPEEVTKRLAQECKVLPESLYVILVPTVSLAGSVQISGRVVESGVHKLFRLGVDPLCIRYACGFAPIAPVCLDFVEAMGRVNDAVLYGGVVFFALSHEKDGGLRQVLHKAPSSSSGDYGRPFAEVFRESGCDFYRVDSGLFAPAVFIVNNVVSGSVLRVGEVNVDVLKRSFGLV